MEKKFSNQIIEQTKEGKEKDRTTFKKYNKERLDIKGRPMKIESKQGLRQKKRNQKVLLTGIIWGTDFYPFFFVILI